MPGPMQILNHDQLKHLNQAIQQASVAPMLATALTQFTEENNLIDIVSLVATLFNESPQAVAQELQQILSAPKDVIAPTTYLQYAGEQENILTMRTNELITLLQQALLKV